LFARILNIHLFRAARLIPENRTRTSGCRATLLCEADCGVCLTNRRVEMVLRLSRVAIFQKILRTRFSSKQIMAQGCGGPNHSVEMRYQGISPSKSTKGS